MESFIPLLPSPPEPNNNWTRPLGLAVEKLIRFLKGMKRDGSDFVFDNTVFVPGFVSRRYVTHPDNGCVGDGVTNNSAALAALASGHYYVGAGTYKVTTAGTVTVPAGVTLEFERGALLDVGSSTTLVIAGAVVAGSFQIFRHTAGTSASDVRFTGTTREVRASWWGIVGDNATNNTFALRVWMTSLIPATGSALLLLDVQGTIVTDTLAMFRTAARVHGLGVGLTELKMKSGFSGSAPLLSNQNETVVADGCELAHLTLNGNRANVSGAATGDGNAMGFRVCGFTNLSVHHVAFKDCWTDGLYIGLGTAATQNVHVNECTFTNCRRNNISVVHCLGGSVTRCRATGATGTAPTAGIDVEPLTGETVSDFLIQGNYFGSNAGHGVQIHGGVGGTLTRVRVVGNHCISNTLSGIALSLSATVSTGKVDVAGNTCYGNTVDGIAVVSTSVTSYDYNQVTGNRCEANGGQGIRIEHSAWNAVTGNLCTGNTGSGILVTSDTSESNLIEGNHCMLNGVRGIYLFATAKYNRVSGNTCGRNQTDGIALRSGTSECSVVGNTVMENSQATDATSDGILIDNDCDRNLIQGNQVRRGALAKRQRYGININSANCDANTLGPNDTYDGGTTANENDAGTTTFTLPATLADPGLTRLTSDNSPISAGTTPSSVSVLNKTVDVGSEWDFEWRIAYTLSVATDVVIVNVSAGAGTCTGVYEVVGVNGAPDTGAGTSKRIVNDIGTALAASTNCPGNPGSTTLKGVLVVRTSFKQTVAAGSVNLGLRAVSSGGASSGTLTVKTQSQLIYRSIT